MDWVQLGQISYVIASVFQVAAMIFAARMALDVKDRRPWLVLLAALTIMFLFRAMVVVFGPKPLEPYSPIAASAISVLLFVSLFYIRTISIAKRESENRYRALVELSPDAIFVNANDAIAYINPAALRFFGATTADQLIGRSPLDFTAPESVGLVRERIADLFGGRPWVPIVEEQWVRLDGTRITVEAVASIIPWQGGRAIQVVLRDTSERKRAENEKARLLASERVARSNAEQANRMKDEFLTHPFA